MLVLISKGLSPRGRISDYVIELKLSSAEEVLAQIKAWRYYDPCLADPRPVILLAAGARGLEKQGEVCHTDMILSKSLEGI